MTQPSPTTAPPEAATSTGEKPAEKPTPARQAKPKQPRIVPLGPTLVALGLMAVIGELILFQSLPLPIALAVNAVAVVAALIVWVSRKRKARAARRAAAGRPLSGGIGRTGRGNPLAALGGVAARVRGRGTGGSSPGRAASAGVAAPSGGFRGLAGRARGLMSRGRAAAGRSPGAGPAGSTRSAGPAPRGSRPPAGGGLRGLASRARGMAGGGRSAAGARTLVGKPSSGQGRGGLPGGLRGAAGALRSAHAKRTATRPPGAKSASPTAKGPLGSLWSTAKREFLKGYRGEDTKAAEEPTEPASDEKEKTRPAEQAPQGKPVEKPASTTEKRPAAKVDKPAPTQGGSMTTSASGEHKPRHGEEQSLYAFGEGLKRAPEMFTDWARQVEEWARAAGEEQPLSEAVTEQIRAAAGVLKALSSDASEWHNSFKRNHEADIARTETPRGGSLHIESKADVSAYRRDM